MTTPLNSYAESSFGIVPSFNYVDVSSCILHPKRRRLRHLNGVFLRNLTNNSISKWVKRPSISSQQIIIINNKIGTFDSPLERQLQLRAINDESFLNIFVSLHFASDDEDYERVFYITEVAHESLNPDFQEFNLKSLIHSKDSHFIMKIWTSTKSQPNYWKLFKNYHIQLSSLLYLNKSLDDVKIDVENAVLISLEDGIYALPTTGLNIEAYKTSVEEFVSSYSYPRVAVPSLTFDQIMKLSNLDTVIEDLNRSKKTLTKQIAEEFKNTQFTNDYKCGKLKKMIKKQKEVNSMKKQLLDEIRKRKDKKARLLDSKATQSEHLNTSSLYIVKESYSSLLAEHESVQQSLLLERSKIIKQVLEIFPVSDIQVWLKLPDFQILPSELNLSTLSNLINTNNSPEIERVNAGFGYIAHMVFLLSRYLAIPLKYQIKYVGSSSYIIDRISQINQRKIFPLFYTNHFYRFQYAITLLNKNIQDILQNSYQY